MSFWVEIIKNPLLFDLVFAAPFFLIGLATFLWHKFRFGVPLGSVAISVKNPQRKFTEGWHWGADPNNLVLISTEPLTTSVPEKDHLVIETPDDGILGAIVKIIYTPDESNGKHLIAYSKTKNLNDILTSRVKSALQSWAWQKNFPATSRQAVANKAAAEKAVISKLTGLHSEALVVFADTESLNRYSIPDLGIVIREVHIADFWEIKKGTGKSDWGDDSHIEYDAEKIRLRIRRRIKGVSNLRIEEETLKKEYPLESDFIERLIEDERIRSMEHRDQ